MNIRGSTLPYNLQRDLSAQRRALGFNKRRVSTAGALGGGSLETPVHRCLLYSVQLGFTALQRFAGGEGGGEGGGGE